MRISDWSSDVWASDLVIASRKLDACQRAADEISAATGRRALAVSCHVGRWDDCDELVRVVYEELGRCDVLVNNAGMSPLYDGLPSVTEELYDKVHAVNAKGPFRLAALFGSRMAEADGGSIINVSTAGSLRSVEHTSELQSLMRISYAVFCLKKKK